MPHDLFLHGALTSAFNIQPSALYASPMSVTVATLLRDLADSRELPMELLAGQPGLERRITIAQPQKTGLALSGFDAYLHGGRVLVFGESEVRYVESLGAGERRQALERVFGHDLPCVLITGGFTPAAEIADAANRASVPLLRTQASTPEAITRLSALLDTHLAARGMVHGVLMDILGLGVLALWLPVCRPVLRARVRATAAHRDPAAGQAADLAPALDASAPVSTG